MMRKQDLVPTHLQPMARSRQQDAEPVARRELGLRGFSMPAPANVKRAVLLRYGRETDTWIETGTYLGDTTAFLARRAKRVYSIEPEPTLARQATRRFSGVENVTIVEGLSEDNLAGILSEIEGPVSFWLDGHYSAGITFKDRPTRPSAPSWQQ